MLCLASTRASSLREFNVPNVDCDNRGKSARVEKTLTHHFDHSRLGTMSMPPFGSWLNDGAHRSPNSWKTIDTAVIRLKLRVNGRNGV
jgi:hypothetical protein